MSKELEELREKAAELRRKNAAKMKQGYRYAKSLGFSPSEAAVLMGKSKEYIDKLAFEREVTDVKTS